MFVPQPSKQRYNVTKYFSAQVTKYLQNKMKKDKVRVYNSDCGDNDQEECEGYSTYIIKKDNGVKEEEIKKGCYSHISGNKAYGPINISNSTNSNQPKPTLNQNTYNPNNLNTYNPSNQNTYNPNYHNNYNSKTPQLPPSLSLQPIPSYPPLLIQCPICLRHFNQKAHQKHVPICEKNVENRNKRRVFQSKRQRGVM